MKISRARAIEILRQHGLTTLEPTATKDGQWVQGTSFADTFQLALEIDAKNFFAWLGY